jgi:hypothetical protein
VLLSGHDVTVDGQLSGGLAVGLHEDVAGLAGSDRQPCAPGAKVAHLGVLHGGAEQGGQPVAGELEERLVGEHADVEQAVAHVGQRRHAEVAAVVGGVAEHHEVAVDALLLGLDADQG